MPQLYVTQRELMQVESCQSPKTAANVEGEMHGCVVVESARFPFLLLAFPGDSAPQWPPWRPPVPVYAAGVGRWQT